MTTAHTTSRAPITTTAGLVACDYDWTLAPTGTPPSPAVIAAVARIQEAGDHFALATSRSLLGAASAARSLGLTTGHIVASGGAVGAVIEGIRVRVLWEHAAPAEKALGLMAPHIESGRLIAAAEVVGQGYRVTSRFPDRELPGVQWPSTLEELWAAPTPRVILRGSGALDLIRDLHDAGVGAFRDACRDDWVDVTARTETKEQALRRLRTELGVHPDRTAAVGDGPNDGGMLTMFARLAFVMGNASQEMQNLVLSPTVGGNLTGTVHEDGAASALDIIGSWLSDSRVCQGRAFGQEDRRCDRTAIEYIPRLVSEHPYWLCRKHAAERGWGASEPDGFPGALDEPN